MRVVENQSKIVLKTTLCWDAKTTTQTCQKMIQHGSKLGPSWGHVGFQNHPGCVQGRKKCIPEAIRKEIRKSIEKPRSGEAPRREAPGGVEGKWPDFGPHYNLLSTLAPIQQDLKTLRLQASKLLKGLYCTEASKTSTWSFSWTVDWYICPHSLVAPKGPADTT